MKAFLTSDKKKWRDFIARNTERNSDGDAIISEDDPWFYEDEWDVYYKELTKRDNPAAGSVVR